MSLEKIVAEALAGRPLEMKEAFEAEIQTRIQARLEAEYMDMIEAKGKKEDDEDMEDDDTEDEDEDEDEDEEDEDEDK
jgi:phosphopantothenoylcysteine synthetase/decarboxylase